VPRDDGKLVKKRCDELRARQQWTDLASCAHELQAFDAAAADAFRKQAVAETQAEIDAERVIAAVKIDDLDAARAALAKIPPGSIYRKRAQDAFDRAAKPASDPLAKAKDLAAKGQCADLDELRAHAPPNLRGKLASITCAADPKADACSAAAVEAHRQAGTDAFAAASFAQALAEFEAVLHCTPGDGPTLKKLYLAACRAHAFPKAKQAFNRLGSADQQRLMQVCLSEGFDPSK
jgi:hypothetical protein